MTAIRTLAARRQGAVLRLGLAALLSMSVSVNAGDAGPDLVKLAAVAPSIVIDLRYAGSNNFTGQALPGYAGATCRLVAAAAEALSRVQDRLAKDGLGLAVLDCYRPPVAVRALTGWARTPAKRQSFAPAHPRVRRGALVRGGYIANRSRHSLGIAVDLTLVQRGGLPAAASAGDCTAPALPAAEGSLAAPDMGTAYDCFDPASSTNAKIVPEAAQRYRALLRQVMAAEGFRNFQREWWHFEFTGAAKP